MTVATKEEEKYNFSLTGIAAAFTGLNRCGAAIRAEKNVTPNVNTASIGTAAPAAQPSIHEVPLVRDTTVRSPSWQRSTARRRSHSRSTPARPT